jgi:SAM-dependent methyltransferase
VALDPPPRVSLGRTDRRPIVSDTDGAWEYYGRENPYYGVLTNERFSRDRLDAEARSAFFASGQEHLASILRTVHDHLDPDFRPTRALDFGCGVGRVTLPLAEVCESVVGVDISESMLAEAAANAAAAGLPNVEFVKADDRLVEVNGTFDLVHSIFVFQHIECRRGNLIARSLVDRLREGGVGVLQFTYADASRTPRWRRTLTAAYARSAALFKLRSLVKRQPLSRPQMQMNKYDLNRLLQMLQESDCHDIHVRFTEASHYSFPLYGVILHFSKRRFDTEGRAPQAQSVGE